MGRTNLAFFQSPTQGDEGTKCADVLITPASGDMPLSVLLETTQTSGHIFYRVSNDEPIAPQHVGDNATAPTIRVGTNNASVFLGAGQTKYISAVCYQSGLLDSNITEGGPYERADSGQ